MAKVKVTTRFKLLDFIDKFVDNATANDIGQAVVDEAKRMVSEGQSPVRGQGRFEAYKAQARITAAKKVSRAEAKGHDKHSVERFAAKQKFAVAEMNAQKGYPYSVMKDYPDKQVRPVNLELSHDMMNGYGFELVNPTTIKVGHVNGPAKSKEIAGYHNEGTKKMARRATVPQPGEEWAVSIMRIIRDRYGARLAQLIRQSNKAE